MTFSLRLFHQDISCRFLSLIAAMVICFPLSGHALRAQEATKNTAVGTAPPTDDAPLSVWRDYIQGEFERQAALFAKISGNEADVRHLDNILHACDTVLKRDAKLSVVFRIWVMRRKAALLNTLVRWRPNDYYDHLADFLPEWEERMIDIPGEEERENLAAISIQLGFTLLRAQIDWLRESARNGAEVDFDAILAYLLQYAQKYPGSESLNLVMQLMEVSKQFPAKKRNEHLLKVARSFSELYGTSRNVEELELGRRLAGLARQIELPGNPVQWNAYLLDGTRFDPRKIAGKVVLIDFWETTCGPCLKQMPGLILLYEKYRARGFEVIGVSSDKNLETLRKFIAEKNIIDGKKIPWPIVADIVSVTNKETPLSEYYGVLSMPTLFLVGRDGKVISTAATSQNLEGLLVEALDAAPNR